MAPAAEAATFIQGTAKDSNGRAVKYATVSLSCYNYSTYKYPWQSTTTDSNGAFSLSTSETYGPCGSYAGGDYTCTLYSYPPYGESNLVTAREENVTPDCDDVETFNLVFQVKDKTIRVTLSDGVGTIRSGMTVWTSNQGNGGDYASTSTATSTGVYDLPAVQGKYYVGAYCTNYTDCDYSGYPSTYLTLGANDTVAETTLTFKTNDSSLAVAVTDGTKGISGAWVSAYSYGNSTSSYSTGTSEYIYVSGQTDSNGAVVLKVPAGTYTVYVSPPYQSSYVSTSQEITVGRAELLALSVVLKSKTAQIPVTVLDEDGNPIANAYVSAWVSDGGTYDWFWGQTDNSGKYTGAAVEGLTYQVSAYYYPSYSSGVSTSKVCTYNLEGYQSVTAASTPVALGFTFPICDHTLNVSTVDAAGARLSSVNSGWIEARPASQSSSDFYYSGVGGSLISGVGSVQVRAGVEYTVALYLWDSSYIAGDAIKVTTGATGATTDLSFTLAPINATISGSYLDADGNAIAEVDTGYMSVYATSGRNYRNCTSNTGAYECKVSAGRWCLGYWVDYNSGYVSTSPGSATSCVTVAANATTTNNITLLKTGAILVKVLNPVGTPIEHVWVEAKATSVADYGDTSEHYFQGQDCDTGSDGTCTIHVGATSSGTTYYVNAYTPWGIVRDNGWTQPSEEPVTVAQGGSAELTLSFGKPDGQVRIKLHEGAASISAPMKSVHKAASDDTSIVANATIDIFSNSGAYATATTDSSGDATMNCTVADTWYAVAYHLVSNALYMSEVTEIKCKENGVTENLTIKHAASLPECQSKTFDAGTATTLECTDGFSVSFPANCLATSGEQVSVNVAATVTPFMANLRPASFYGYTISASKASSGEAIITLNSDATLVVPVTASQLENVGLDVGDLEACFYDNTKGAYKSLANSTNDAEGLTVTMTTDHLTDFVVAGNGNLKGLDGTTDGVEPEDAGTGETGSAASGAGGCGCRTVPTDHADWRDVVAGLLLALPLLFIGTRRQRMLVRVP